MDASPRRGFTVPDYIDDEEDEEGAGEADHTRLAHATNSVGIPNLATKTPAALIDLTLDNHECNGQRSTAHPRARSVFSPFTGSPDCVLLTDIITNPLTNPTANRNVSSDFVDLTSEICESDAEESDARPSASPSAKVEVRPPHMSSSKSSSSAEPTIHNTDKAIPTTSSPAMALDEDKHTSELESDDDTSNEDAESECSHDSELESEASLELMDEMSETSDVSDVSEDFDMHNQPPMYQTFDDLIRGSGVLKAFGVRSSESKCRNQTNTRNITDSQGESSMRASEDSHSESGDESYFDREEDDEQNTLTALAYQPHRVDTAASGMLTPKQMDNEATNVPVASRVGHHSRARPWELNTTNCNHYREPSPSDAALFVRRNSPDEARARELGERTGKFDFFAAREKNRAILNQHSSVAPSPTMGGAPLNTQPQGDDSAESELVSSRPWRSIITATATETTDKMTKPGFRPIVDEQPLRSQSIEHPLSRSCAHGQPKDADMANAPNGRELLLMAAMGSQPRRLPIQSLLGPESNQSSPDDQPTARVHGQTIKNHTPAPTKRSHDVAFDGSGGNAVCKDAENVMISTAAGVIETESQDRLSHDKVDVQSDQGDLLAEEIADLEEQVLATHEPTTTSVEPEAPRPTKRARIATTTAQVVVCVALGGAATFSYLVNTAPVF